MLDKEEVVKRLCKLAMELNRDYFGYSVASDCFCSHGGFDDYRFEEVVLDFIEEAVKLRVQQLLIIKSEEEHI